MTKSKKAETKTPETTENAERKNALAIAEKITEIMGKDFFTIEQMRKKMVITNGSRPAVKLSWQECRNYVISIMKYGLAEPLAVNDWYKIRLDSDFQLNYFDKQIDIRNDEIKVYKSLMQEIFDKDSGSEPPKMTVKKAVVKKTTSKK